MRVELDAAGSPGPLLRQCVKVILAAAHSGAADAATRTLRVFSPLPWCAWFCSWKVGFGIFQS